jgi:cell division protein DivIC
LNVQLEELKEKEEELSTDVLKLQDPEYIARYLREKYYYSKNNEYIIKLPDKK